MDCAGRFYRSAGYLPIRPGILAVNISIFIGYKLRGNPGKYYHGMGTILPSFIIILAIALFFHSFKDNPIVERIFKGIRPQW